MLNRSPGAHWSTFIADRSATVMQASGNRIARGVVQALESQVINTARYMGRTERSLCVASNRGHRRIYERIAAHDPDGAAEAMFTHITEAWLVRRSGSGKPTRLQRWPGQEAGAQDPRHPGPTSGGAGPRVARAGAA
ncbi:FCD domain-containing protein [Micromonospora sp. DSM 115977]|uniref:FCD domain-containing protein n=1 Tax=Micromonospora reichwaldensis TaxID=3075516 RepID=A0ABU2WZI1_9ACTN|nr:FCD domain-containing protein [Micromonospora sp. DSM 115977]MDT0530945.1 FCD domain-containing protein [Micromonospora sp. DSM 115977]